MILLISLNSPYTISPLLDEPTNNHHMVQLLSRDRRSYHHFQQTYTASAVTATFTIPLIFQTLHRVTRAGEKFRAGIIGDNGRRGSTGKSRGSLKVALNHFPCRRSVRYILRELFGTSHSAVKRPFSGENSITSAVSLIQTNASNESCKVQSSTYGECISVTF